ncbi:hypothetical protein SRABI118_01750 [Massilia sp. Bi118]|uniref:DUF4153 domain-containing protein n=1 Tax=Massilia sp. Bi118 TaxID=2822346 RepID=UPI001D310230|nr:DUF4153 domain-containing protein [Massilia sp. Bi118]CAH0201585.1 hypothetical protein SRABI118_01750 [Massilia sp. Bi118]
MQALDPSDSPSLPALSLPGVGSRRILVGLVQGLLLYLLYRAGKEQAWPATVSLLFVPLVLAALIVPVILVSGLGHMPRRQLLLWGGAALLLLAGLGCYDAWRVADLPLPPTRQDGPFPPSSGIYRSLYPSPPLVSFAMAGFFIAHTLVLAAVRDKRRIAAYATYFDIAWKHGVQLAFSGLFTGVTWLVLALGSQLFELVKLTFLTELIREEWFAIPVTAFAFSCAMHLTDVRPAIVRGIRSLLLVLLSWLLPVIVLLVGGFLLALPFTGLEPLWATRRAAAVLLVAAAGLVVLINAAWQNGEDGKAVARVVRVAARAASLLLAPLVLIAVYALSLRVRDYGWTGDRVSAAACMLVAACYAAGYFRAALRPGWLPALASVNTGTAFVVLGLLVLLFSPLLDPARVSVSSQAARLASGKVQAERFDFAFLRFDGERYGRAALDRIEREAAGAQAALVRRRIAIVRNMKSRWNRIAPAAQPADLGANLLLRQPGARLPDSFLRTDWALKDDPFLYPDCLREPGKHCDAFQLDVNGDGKPEVFLSTRNEVAGAVPNTVVLAEDAQGQWTALARVMLPRVDCQALREALAAGKVATAPPALADIEIGGARARLQPVAPGYGCISRKR